MLQYLNFQTCKVKQNSLFLSSASKIISIHIKASSKIGRPKFMYILKTTVVILQASLVGLGIQMGPLYLLTL